MKSVLIIGLGRFGRHIAMKLNELNHQVMAVDTNEERVNAVLPFREWLDDFADEATRALARPVLEKEIEEIRQTLPKFFPAFKEHYDRIVAGERDLFF